MNEDPRPVSNIPVPDPSVLTTEALRDGLSTLKDLLESRMVGLQNELYIFRSGHEEKHVLVVDAAIQHRKELSEAQLAILKAQVDSQYQAVRGQLDIASEDLSKRFIASDLRYQQRYDAQSQALDAAFEAQQKATAAALAAAKEAVITALTASEKAVSKAEVATEKLIPRAEVESRLTDVTHQVAVAGSVVDRRLATMTETLRTLLNLSDRLEKVSESVTGLDRVTDAKFTTFRALINAESAKVALELQASNKAVDAAFASSAAAISKAETFNEKRFDSVNEFRQTLTDQTHTFIPRAEAEARMTSLGEKIDDLKASQQSLAGRASATPTMDTRVIDMMAEIRQLREARSADQGKSQGLNAGWGYLIGAIGLIVVAVNVITTLVSK